MRRSGRGAPLRRRLALLLLALPVAVAALEFPGFDDEVMRAMDDAFKDLEPVLGASNVEAARSDIAVLKDGYQWTAEYFQQDRGAPEAAGILTAGLAIVGEVERAVGAGDFTLAVTRARELQANCKSCHDRYKPKKQ